MGAMNVCAKFNFLTVDMSILLCLIFLSAPPGGADGGSSCLWEERLGEELHEAASRETAQTAGNGGAARLYDCQSDLRSSLL